MAIPHLKAVVNGFYMTDGGSIDLRLLDDAGLEHGLELVQHVIPENSTADRRFGRIPGGTFHISRLRAGSAFALLGTTEWPAFEPPDLELGDPDKLMAEYPAFRRDIEDFIKQSTG